MKAFKFLLVVLTLSPWFSVFSYQAKVTQHNVCVYKKVTYRSVRIQQASDVCDVIYTKLGLDGRIASRSNVDSCSQVFKNIKENLTKAGWSCMNAFSSGFTFEKS